MKWHISHVFRITTWLLFCALPVVTLAPQAVAGKESIRLVVAFSPGGALDSATRALAREAEKELGLDIIVQNTPGGAGMTAVAQLAESEADGLHLAACAGNALLFLPHRNLVPYDPLRDVEPLLVFGQASPVLVTRPDAPWKDMASFLETTRKNGGKMRIGVPGLGTPSHTALAMIAAKDKTLSWRFIPFGGPGEAEAALLGGHVDAAASGALPRIRQGQLFPLMILAGTGPDALPQTPSLSDGGFADPGRGDASFFLLAPKNVPEKTLNRLSPAFEKAARSEAFLKELEHFSVAPVLKNRREAKAFLAEAWKEEEAALKAAGLAE